MINIKDIKERVSIRECLEFYGVKFLKNNFAYCPFHKEQHPSFYIYPEDDMFVCFSCGARGDAVQFVQMYFNISFKEALNKLNEDFSLGLNKKSSAETKERINLDKIIRDAESKLKEEKNRLYNEYCERLRILNKALYIIEKEDVKAAAEIKKEMDSIESILDKEFN